MKLDKIRIYMDTSVFGGCFDNEFSKESIKLFEEIDSGRFTVIVSQTLVEELRNAPDHVKSVLISIPNEFIENVKINTKIEELRDGILKAKILGKASRIDAEHIACATVANADIIVSWNFKHIVNFLKIKGFHAISILHGFHPIPIHTPSEVIEQ